MPSRMRERGEAVARGELDWTPPALRDAATVCLLRSGPSGLEVFLMRRTTSMAFAAGMYVYPGGAVEDSDSRAPVAGRVDLGLVGHRTTSPDPRALLVAAARETFEECGVLLALDADGVGVRIDSDLEAERAALVAQELTFTDLLMRRGLVVDDGAIVPFAHWVTPEVEDRRFDTRFFVTALPAGQDARHIGGEADRAAWWRPIDALSALDEGRMAMMQQLLVHDDPASAVAAMSRLEVVPLRPAPFIDDADELVWHLLDHRTGAIAPPAVAQVASDTDGVGRGDA